MVENVTFAERVMEVFDTAKWQALKSGQKGSRLMFKDNSYYIYAKMGHFWAQSYFFEFFSKYIHWAFMNLYLMKILILDENFPYSHNWGKESFRGGKGGGKRGGFKSTL